MDKEKGSAFARAVIDEAKNRTKNFFRSTKKVVGETVDKVVENAGDIVEKVNVESSSRLAKEAMKELEDLGSDYEGIPSESFKKDVMDRIEADIQKKDSDDLDKITTVLRNISYKLCIVDDILEGCKNMSIIDIDGFLSKIKD